MLLSGGCWVRSPCVPRNGKIAVSSQPYSTTSLVQQPFSPAASPAPPKIIFASRKKRSNQNAFNRINMCYEVPYIQMHHMLYHACVVLCRACVRVFVCVLSSLLFYYALPCTELTLFVERNSNRRPLSCRCASSFIWGRDRASFPPLIPRPWPDNRSRTDAEAAAGLALAAPEQGRGTPGATTEAPSGSGGVGVGAKAG